MVMQQTSNARSPSAKGLIR